MKLLASGNLRIDIAVLQSVLGPERVKFTTFDSKPVRAILSYLEGTPDPVDLLVLGSRGHTTLPRPHIGSVTFSLAHRADINLFVAGAE
ncbi:MAG: hypothetical protein C4318_08005 [Acidimicrobiia bacterium]